MRLNVQSICLFFVLIPFLNGCSQDDELAYEYIVFPNGEQVQAEKPSIDTNIKDGEEVSILPSRWMDYYRDLSDYTNVDKLYASGVEISKPEAVKVKWTCEDNFESFEVYLATNREMKNTSLYTCDDKEVAFYDLFAGTHYYYQIVAKYIDKTVVSRRFDFKTYDFFRTIDINGVCNARDIGNKKTDNNKQKVKQGLVYRSASLDDVTSFGIKDSIKRYSIKTDLDLRESGPTSSPLGSDVSYINNGVGDSGSPMYTSLESGVNNEIYREVMKNNLKVFTDSNNFPLVFHCAVGRDRTGTLAITLFLLLGINLEQIKQDYMVSFFSRACNSEDLFSYNNEMLSLIEFFNHYRGKNMSNKSIYEKAEAYCLDIGLTKDDISLIRNNLLENI